MLFRLNEKKGVALIIVYALLTLIFIILSVIFYSSTQSMKMSQARISFIRAFYAAESGIDAGLQLMPVGAGSVPLVINKTLGSSAASSYAAVINLYPLDPAKWVISSTGYCPDSVSVPRAEVALEAVVDFIGADNFFDHALYSAANLTLKGNAYSITGDVYYDENSNIDVNHDNVSGEIIPGEVIDFLGDIDWSGLRNIAACQDPADVFDHVIDVGDFETSSLPASFWYDEANAIPNVIYVEGSGNLQISGNRTIGGFLVVVSGDCEISGTVTLDGCLLVKDDIKVSGTVNIIGGIWAGGVVDDEAANKDGVFISGNISLIYDQTYMDAIKDNIQFLKAGSASVLSWKEIRREMI